MPDDSEKNSLDKAFDKGRKLGRLEKEHEDLLRNLDLVEKEINFLRASFFRNPFSEDYPKPSEDDLDV